MLLALVVVLTACTGASSASYVNISGSSIQVNAANVPASGIDTATVTLTLRQSNGAALASTWVRFNAPGHAADAYVSCDDRCQWYGGSNCCVDLNRSARGHSCGPARQRASEQWVIGQRELLSAARRPFIGK